MKKSFVVLLFSSFAIFSFAQSFNLSMGIGLSQQIRSTYIYGQDGLKPLQTLNSQFSRDYRIWKNVFLRSELSYFQEGFYYPSYSYYETFHYLGIDNFLLFRTFSSPVYLGVGGYGAWLVSVSNTIGEDVIVERKDLYDSWDYGVIPTLGLSLDFDFITYFIEFRYRLGFNDILIDQNNYIKNQSAEFNFGVSFHIH